MHHTDVIIIGAGLAGLTCAWRIRNRSVAVLRPRPEDGSSYLARGGIAAAIGEDDNPRCHVEDTLVAADGIADPDAVRMLADEGVQRMVDLFELPIDFDRDDQGRLQLGREALHSRDRIVHVAGDKTGHHVTSAVHDELKHRDNVTFVDGRAVELLTDGDRAFGVVYVTDDGTVETLAAPSTVLATGGVGALFDRTTNPGGARGEGLAIAARAGARLADLEFVQFHPTALDVDRRQLPLLSEAIRGQGATLIDHRGRPVMNDHPRGDLAGRDVVARQLWQRLADGDDVYLDVTGIDDFSSQFPAAATACRRHGFDPHCDPLPVTPAAHYHMGGVATDARARTSLRGLWAIGEVASTGVHGANRLASNSLLEALVFGARAGRDIATGPRHPHHVPIRRLTATITDWQQGLASSDQPTATYETLIQLMWDHVGIQRSRSGLEQTLAALNRTIDNTHRCDRRRLAVETARLITRAALAREESRGAHYRTDFPRVDSTSPMRTLIDGGIIRRVDTPQHHLLAGTQS